MIDKLVALSYISTVLINALTAFIVAQAFLLCFTRHLSKWSTIALIGVSIMGVIVNNTPSIEQWYVGSISKMSPNTNPQVPGLMLQMLACLVINALAIRKSTRTKSRVFCATSLSGILIVWLIMHLSIISNGLFTHTKLTLNHDIRLFIHLIENEKSVEQACSKLNILCDYGPSPTPFQQYLIDNQLNESDVLNRIRSGFMGKYETSSLKSQFRTTFDFNKPKAEYGAGVILIENPNNILSTTVFINAKGIRKVHSKYRSQFYILYGVAFTFWVMFIQIIAYLHHRPKLLRRVFKL
ncbi:hypothetical protein AB6D11_06025 [Vibrio splendidus]